MRFLLPLLCMYILEVNVEGTITAKATIINANLLTSGSIPDGESWSLGTIKFEQQEDSEVVQITGSISGLTPGKHGFHIHALADISSGCSGAGGHYNPAGLTHGGISSQVRHVGDLGNIEAGDDGVAILDLLDNVTQLKGWHSIIGRAVVVHAGEDDLGEGGDSGSLSTGNAGGRVGCGVIGVTSNNYDSFSETNNPGCWDLQGDCVSLVYEGKCAADNELYLYMKAYCRRSCGLCDD